MFKTANVYMQINRTTLYIFYFIRKVSSDGTSQEVIIIISYCTVRRLLKYTKQT